MAGRSSSHSPLSFLDHLKIKEATKHLHSRFITIRNAAAKEIQRILARRQQARGRLDPRKWARQAWGLAHRGRLHKCGNCEYGVRDRAMFRQHVNGHQREAGEAVRTGPAATPGLRERQGHAKSPARTPETRRPTPVRTQDMRRQSGLLPQDQKQRPWSGRVEPQPQGGPTRRPKPPARPGPVTNATLRAEAREGRQRPARDVRAPAGPAAAPKLAPARTPPLPHETVRAPRTPKARLRVPRLRARA